ncbi:MAG: FtsQ-type POTRA domain-containing protein [bacterium]|nr:FtsQ-type POTRA domain-containing protein [bacterium]
MSQKSQKKRRLKIIPVMIILLVLLALYGLIRWIYTFPITNIYIEGNHYLKDQEIIELAKIDHYPSFLGTKEKNIQKHIQKNPLVFKVTVQKKWWGTIKIKVEEYNVLFRQYNDDQLVVLENKKEIQDPTNQYSVPKLLNYVPDNKYNQFIKGMNQVDEDIKNLISEITYLPNEQDKDRFLLYMVDGNYVYLTLTKFKQINYYEDVLKKLKGQKGILYLDSGNHFRIMSE